ncbi:TetR/AcrR family transcriptional regulator [Streptacidiphilus pinicola]|uniref:TetR/AcrR family transcriptional regulator n=1 Tax=Streptacidiphilus pinicola TaxID=2219663 RepID=A0A2X0J487_9ACTN|nr:ScbR family autoregulator-binding transcription factor [Streptacidiphilus pinicola]RAG85046.1 TetR/AcrR family transcriptional regulator [Streptacidiphilus pinicola]
MGKQERGTRTRQTILTAAAEVFEQRGYEATTVTEILRNTNVTKGALYFHFSGKEELAQGLLQEQDEAALVPERACRTQQLVDTLLVYAHRLQTDALVRARARLAMDQVSPALDRREPYLRWRTIMLRLLEQAQAQGELLATVDPAGTAEVLVGGFTGVQSMSLILTSYEDLMTRTCALLRHLLPSIATAPVLVSLDLSGTRGAEVFAETQD